MAKVLASIYTEMDNKLLGIKLVCVCNYENNILQIEKIGNKIVKVIKMWENKLKKRKKKKKQNINYKSKLKAHWIKYVKV